MRKFGVGDRVVVVNGEGGEQVGLEGTVTGVDPDTGGWGDGDFVLFSTDDGRPTGLFAHRLGKAKSKPDLDSDFIKARDEALSNLEDALDAIKAKVLASLSDFLDNNARR